MSRVGKTNRMREAIPRRAVTIPVGQPGAEARNASARRVLTVGDIARSMGAKAKAAMRHHLGASHRQTETVHEEPAPRPKRISRGARARATRPEVRRMLPACVIKSMRRIQARRAANRWDGIVR